MADKLVSGRTTEGAVTRRLRDMADGTVADVVLAVAGAAAGVPGHPVPGSAWVVRNMPAANTIAVASTAAAGAGKRQVLTGATFVLTADTAAPTAAAATYVYIQNTGIIVWSNRISLPAVAGEMRSVTFQGSIVSDDNGTIAVGFIGAGGANTFESVSMTGHVVTTV